MQKGGLALTSFVQELDRGLHISNIAFDYDWSW